MQEGGENGRGGQLRKASTESSQARPKKMKTAGSASRWHGGEAQWLSFKGARKFVRTLKLGNQREWKEYYKSGKRPSNIPSAPDKVYRDAGWISIPDWLGYEGKKKMAKGGALSFEAARTFVRTLELGSHKAWEEYSKSGKRPSNIQSAPDKVYRNAGWTSWHDWLGCGVTL